MTRTRDLFVLFALFSVAGGISRSDLYPFGPIHGDQQLTIDIDDISSPEVQLQTSIVFYGQTYTSIYVNSNGLLSFLTEIPSFFNVQFPLDYPIIAPFYSDVDTRESGTVYYRETKSADLLNRMNEAIQRHFLTGTSFEGTSAFIATWDNVGYYNSKGDKLNTYQVVLLTNGQDTYAIFLYEDIQWIHGEGKSTNLPDARAQAGFMPGDGRMYLLTGSGTDQVRSIHRLSNVGEAGLWMFHIGQLGTTGNVEVPDINIGSVAVLSQSPQNCVIGAAFCHTNARCIDYSPGFCCECSSGYYGNGKNCLEEAIPQRLNGKVSGSLNGEKIDDSDLHSYVVTTDGRAYTAVSRIPPALGYDMQSLLSIGGIVGWLFAVPRASAKNGYMLTGGVCNRTAEINFPQSGHSVRILQFFHGVDVYNYLRMSVQIQGTVPNIPFGSKIEVDDFEEEYTRVGPGILRSHAKRSYHLEGNNVNIGYTVDQTITFDECLYAPLDSSLSTTRLKQTRNFIVYDNREQIVRYAMTNKIGPLSTEDPCKEGAHLCGLHSSCVVEGDTYRCVCDPGYEYLYEDDVNGERATCIDVNECNIGRDNCHSYAECINQPGSFVCRCLTGYVGDGITCYKRRSCEELGCDENADCIELADENAECRCKPGYQGNGLICEPVYIFKDCQNEEDICDPNADCIYNELSRQYQCQCLPGYNGDGSVCVEEAESCDIAHNCSPFAACEYDRNSYGYFCVCIEGYSGNGYTCNPDGPPYRASCNIINNCHPQAQCIYDTQLGDFTCRCSAGYEGDGFSCTQTEATCDVLNICSIYATCEYDPSQAKHVCRCNRDYEGDGITCSPTDECSHSDECDVNAHCTYDNLGRRYRCICRPGFVGSGKECLMKPDVSCHIIDNCHPNAKCEYDSINLRYRCQCKQGYTGDGFTCERSVVSCNILNTCDSNADCLYDNTAHGYRCSCKQGFLGDGYSCSPLRSCQNDPTQCDPNADCIPHPLVNKYVCQCRHGFHGDGYSCKASPRHDGNFLLVNQGMATVKLPLVSNPKDRGSPIVLSPHQTAVGIDVDCVEGTFYWGDIAWGVIRSAKYDGSMTEVFIDTSLGSPEGMAVDWVSRNVFWTDSTKDTIEVARIESKDRKILFNKDLVNPRGIAVHPGRGKLYWSDWDRRAPKIESANMDGTDRQVFIEENIELPNSLTMDFERDDLCWADAGTQKIECISLTGFNRRTIIAQINYPFGLTNNRDTMYWTDWESRTVQSASKFGYTLNDPIQSPLGGNSKLYGITVVPDQCPRMSNPCAANNGGCRHLCLPNGRGGRTCQCPDFGNEVEVAACNEIN